MLETDEERTLRGAIERLSRPGAWLEGANGRYRVLTGADRRRRPLTTLDETIFAALAKRPGLRLRPEGGWCLASAGLTSLDTPPSPPGDPASSRANDWWWRRTAG